MGSGLSFGAHYVALGSVEARLAFETTENRRERFADVDAIIDRLVLRALHGERVVEPLSERRSEAHLLLTGDDDNEVLAEHFALERQQARGAWYQPKGNRLEVGFVHLAYWHKTKPRHLLTLATEETAAPSFDEVASVVIWAALEPVFDTLSLPLRLRAGRWAGEKPAEKQQPYWTKSIETVYDALGLSGQAVRAFAPNTGWAELTRKEIEARRAALLEPWSQATLDTVARLRSQRIGQLVDRYYAKAKQGKALRSRVMNDRSAERALTTYFGGDWLALLEYLGEEPHADEQVMRALPQPRLMVTSSERAASVAAEHGLPPEEVERMLAAYWGQSDSISPPEQRVRVLKALWHEFDAAHARQAPRMNSLPSIWADIDVDEADSTNGSRADGNIPDALGGDVKRLWATKLNPRNPERLVTEPFCRAAASHTFGPALYFWYRVSLNAWNMCEGGGAHSELEDFEQYLQREVDAVAKVGFPVDPNLFAELRDAESKLGPVEQLYETRSEEQVGPITLSIQLGGRTRRDGFEVLRDIITRYRRGWADHHLDNYLQARWRQELEAVGVAYHRHAADRAKPPTIRQFAAMARDAASHWFAGDVTGVYGALGLTSPIATPSYERVLPANVRAFQRRVGELLEATLRSQAEQFQEHEAEHLKWRIQQLAHSAAEWVELREALGEPPELKQLGTPRFRNASNGLWGDLDEGWKVFSAVVQTALDEFIASAGATTAGPPTEPPPLAVDPVAADHTERVPHVAAPLRPVGTSRAEEAEPDGERPHEKRRSLLHRLFRG